MTMLSKPSERIAAIDVGDVRIGIAIATMDNKIAMPLTTILVENPSKGASAVSEILIQKKISILVVGRPLQLDGLEGSAIQRTKKFLRMLAPLCPCLKFVRQDERLTTAQAEEALVELRVKKKMKKNVVDQIAASLILQCYLDRVRPLS